MRVFWVVGALVSGVGIAFATAPVEEVLKLKLGFVHKLSCEGKLYVSAVGNDNLVRLEALPKELGCAVILKPTGAVGITNLILETSVGTLKRRLIVERP